MADSIHAIAPSVKHTHTIVFLHGRGGTGPEFESELFESQDSGDRFFTDIFPGVKWVFPSTATSYAETEQEDMHQWFDMASVQRPNERPEIQKPGLSKSVHYLLSIVEMEARTVPLNHIVLAGISQGCATAIFALLCCGVQLGGFVGLSGWLPFLGQLRAGAHLQYGVLETPILLQHCRDDSVVPVENGMALADALRDMGLPVEAMYFDDGGHWLNEPAGMDGIVRFLTGIMSRA
ncbi:Alpha/Beta hydrolase protein [Massariosphaeria phaeospora]|uniref:Alpha/Beta hydrolase protein n=1 Tax=Massariosphaeria phaeospora TaxID=100035 RepID=A0A7C8MGE2_9PLEO|nr:Alpha/Beta hydrolase protein [Massariosphaeria phaeospora]